MLERALKRARGNQKEFLKKIEQQLTAALMKNEIVARVAAREKHLYSIYRKMQRKRSTLNEIVDVYGLRIVVDKADTCYRALGSVHSVFKPMPGRFKDYIAIPRVNGYQSLHTTLFGPNGVPIEVQIRTEDMNSVAQSGIAAHWRYKTGESVGSSQQERARDKAGARTDEDPTHPVIGVLLDDHVGTASARRHVLSQVDQVDRRPRRHRHLVGLGLGQRGEPSEEVAGLPTAGPEGEQPVGVPGSHILLGGVHVDGHVDEGAPRSSGAPAPGTLLPGGPCNTVRPSATSRSGRGSTAPTRGRCRRSGVSRPVRRPPAGRPGRPRAPPPGHVGRRSRGTPCVRPVPVPRAPGWDRGSRRWPGSRPWASPVPGGGARRGPGRWWSSPPRRCR